MSAVTPVNDIPTPWPAPQLPTGWEVGSTGGDSLANNLSDIYTNYWGQTAYMLFSTAIVFIIIPGIALVYGGMARRKAAASLLALCFGVCAVGSVQWVIWGYSIAFSPTSTSSFIGNLNRAGLKDLLAAPTGQIPETVYLMYELYFALCTSMLMVGGGFERARLVPVLIFVFIFQTLCYCPIAYWTWMSTGWLNKLGALDFAGGGPVHMTSGMSALAFALILGHRKEHGSGSHVPFHKPHNTTLVMIGTSLIWFGWFGFNGGSDLTLNLRATVAFANTGFAAATGALGWGLVDKFYRKRFSLTGFCSGVISGLVAITPASGHVPIWSSLIIGFTGGALISSLGWVNDLLRIDDGLDVFKIHGIGGIYGALCTGVFAADYIIALDGSSSQGGWITGHWIQMGYQLAEICAICAWSFCISFICLYAMKYIPGLHLRVNEESELLGLDEVELLEEHIGDYTLGQYTVDQTVTREYESNTPPNKINRSSPEPQPLSEISTQ